MLVAQLDRVTGYEPVGQGFESLQARQLKHALSVLFCYNKTRKSFIEISEYICLMRFYCEIFRKPLIFSKKCGIIYT